MIRRSCSVALWPGQLHRWALAFVSDVTPEAEQLSSYMSDLSERAYCAEWMEGLEYALWDAVLKGRSKYGRLQLTSQHISKLHELSRACGGWVVFDDTDGPTFLPLPQWLTMYDAHGI